MSHRLYFISALSGWSIDDIQASTLRAMILLGTGLAGIAGEVCKRRRARHGDEA
ncbi:MAG: hypothetical protein ACR2G5_05085 [Pyrinomonadaceae bacterium]